MSRRALLALAVPVLIAAGALALSPTIGGVAPESRGDTTWIAILSGQFAVDTTTVSECTDAENPRLCYAQAFGNIAFNEGGGRAMSLLLETSAGAEDELSDCHSIAHMVGTASYYGVDKDFAGAIAAGTRECAGGYYHGVAAAEAASNPGDEPAELGVRLANLCYVASRAAPIVNGVSALEAVMTECAHGIGHVAQHTYDYDIPTALISCDAMRAELGALRIGGEEDRETFFTCAQGVFMENRNSGGGPEAKWIKADDPIYPCDEFDDEEVGLACWDVVPSAVTAPGSAGGSDIVEAARLKFEVCAKAEREAWRDRCNAITRRVSINGENMSAALYRAICALDPVSIEQCLRDIGSEIMLRNSSVDLGSIVCSAAESPSEIEACGFGLGEGLRYVPLPIERCDEFAAALIDPCRRAYQLR